MAADKDWRPFGVLGDLLPGDLNDACCWACSGGGDVVCCDGCRAVYHLACIGLQALPDEDFYCPLCSCKQCQGPCKHPHPAVSIMTDSTPVRTKALKPRQAPNSKLPDGPGYICPQQLRLWLQLQPTAHLEDDASSTAQQQQQQPQESGQEAGAEQGATDGGVEDKQAAEPRPKRQKRDAAASTGSNNNSSAPAAAAAAAAAQDSAASSDAFIRCCCCQRACHIKCLPEEQQQHLAAWAAPAPDSTDRDQHKATARASKRLRSPTRGKKQQSKQEQEEQQRQQQEQQEQERLSRPVPPFFCSPGCKQTATALAQRCAMGVVQLDALPDGTPMSWQLIHPAAVAAALAAPPAPVAAAAGAQAGTAEPPADAPAAPAAAAQAGEARSALAEVFAGAAPPPSPVPVSALLGTGVAPGYTPQQAAVLAQVLRDAQQLLAAQLGPAWEVRTLQHCLPWLLSGLRQPTPGGALDLSHMHVAVLWVGCSLAAAALLRVHGGEGGGVLEVTMAATSPLLQHRRLGRMLLGAVERFAMEACRAKQAWMPALGGVVRPCVGASVLPAWEREDGERGRLQLAPGCSTKLLGLDTSFGSSAGGPAAGRSGQRAEDAAQKVPKGVASCWALKLSYGRAANVTDWLQLTRCALLRYSYVPFVSKRLEPQAMLPPPLFRKQQPARPPPLPPLPPQMQLQQRFGMPPGHMAPPAPYGMQQRPVMAPLQPMQPYPMQPPVPAGGLPPLPPLQQQGLQPGPMVSAGDGPGAAPAGGAAELASQQGGVGGVGSGGVQAPAEGGEGGAVAASEGAAAAGQAAIANGDAPAPQQQQQQGAQEAGSGPKTGPAPPQEPQQQPGSTATPAAAAAAAAAASKRQQWKEEVRRQFLAQQAAFAARPPAAAAAASAAPSKQGAAGSGEAPAAAEEGPSDPMQE